MKKILFLFSTLVFCLFISCNDKTAGTSDGMSEQAKKNLEASRAISKAFETGDNSGIDSVVSADFVDHTDRGDYNRDSLKNMITQVRASFPDMKSEVMKEWADDNWVFTQVRYTGTSDGSMGMPVGPYDMHAIHVVRCNDGKIVEHWEYMEMRDMMKMMGQMQPQGDTTMKK